MNLTLNNKKYYKYFSIIIVLKLKRFNSKLNTSTHLFDVEEYELKKTSDLLPMFKTEFKHWYLVALLISALCNSSKVSLSKLKYLFLCHRFIETRYPVFYNLPFSISLNLYLFEEWEFLSIFLQKIRKIIGIIFVAESFSRQF